MPDATPAEPDATMSKLDQWQRLLDNILGYEATWITDIGLKTGLFAAIADAGAGVNEETLAARLGYDRRYVALWCRSAYAFELLDWNEQAGYRLRPELSVRRGDANELDEAGVYDLVTMNITLHETGGPAAHRNVLARVLRALKPAGTLLLAELPYPDAPQAYREQPIYRMLAGLQLHKALVGCGAITQGQLPVLLEEAGFTSIRTAQQPVPSRVVMLADKSAAPTPRSS
jgi:SAM-dependent methyltransferase